MRKQINGITTNFWSKYTHKALLNVSAKILYILISELNEIIKDLKSADQQYIRDGMEELEIQVVKTPKDYDEYKYMTGEEAIAFLQGLSDGKTKAFVKEEE